MDPMTIGMLLSGASSLMGAFGGGSDSASKQARAMNDQAITNQINAGRAFREGQTGARAQTSFGTQAMYTLGDLLGLDPQKLQPTDAYTKYGMYGNLANPYADQDLFSQQHSNSTLPDWAKGQAPIESGMTGYLMDTFGADNFQEEPGYQFRLEQGQKALERSQAAEHNLLSPAAVLELERMNQGYASDEYMNAYNRFTNDQSNIYNRLMGAVGVGQSATGMQMGAPINTSFTPYSQGPSGLQKAASVIGDIGGGTMQYGQMQDQKSFQENLLNMMAKQQSTSKYVG